MPEQESLRVALQLAWQDFFHARTQTWRTLEIEVALTVGLVGADYKFDSVLLAIVLGTLVILAAISGLLITIHHRIGQVTQYRHITNIEDCLELRGVITGVTLPEPFKWFDLIDYKRRYTPVHIMRMHIAIGLFAIIYVVAKCVL